MVHEGHKQLPLGKAALLKRFGRISHDDIGLTDRDCIRAHYQLPLKLTAAGRDLRVACRFLVSSRTSCGVMRRSRS